MGIFYWVAPNAFREELANPWMLLFWTFVFGIPLSLFEYLYHRYLLHSAVLPFVRSMHRAHSHHHGLTAVKAPVTPADPDKMVEVFNEYPIEREGQEESMMFPLYAVSIFYLIFSILLILPFKLLFPGQPIVLGTFFTVTLAYFSYEAWHQVLHLPYDKVWKPLMEGRKRKMVRHIYAFHLMHHWRPSCNQAVVGFWGLAIWDHMFRTHRRPHNLPLKGKQVNYKDINMGKPHWPISMLDKWQPGLFRWSRKVEAGFAKVFLGKKSSA